MSPRSRSLLHIHAAVVLFGLAGLFGKWLGHISAIVIVFGRVVFASLALLGVSWLWPLPPGPRGVRGILPFLPLGLLLAVHWTTFYQSVQDATVAVALLTYSTFPVFVAFLEPLLFRERLHATDVILAGIALAGVAVLAPHFDPHDRTTQGVLWGIASGFTFALLSLLNRKYVRQYASVTIALYQDAFAALALLPAAVLAWPGFTARDVVLLVVLGVLCTALAHSLFIAGLGAVNARTASMIACLEPVYGILLAVLFLDEIPPPRTALGGLLVVGVAFYATVRAGTEAATAKGPPA